MWMWMDLDKRVLSIRFTSSITSFNISGDLALLVDTSHPRIRPDLEKGIEQARKILQSRHLFCLQVSGMLLFMVLHQFKNCTAVHDPQQTFYSIAS